MNLKTGLVSLALMALAGMFTTGCSSDCESVCEDTKECSGVPDELKDADCADQCEKAEKAAEDAGCSDEYDDLASCAAGVDDVCTASGSECASESKAYSECVGVPSQ